MSERVSGRQKASMPSGTARAPGAPLRAAAERPADDPGWPMPAGVRTTLGAPALLKGEDPAAYEQLLSLTADDVKPVGFVEWVHVRQLVDTYWEIRRLRRAITSTVALARKAATRSLLMEVRPHGEWQPYVTLPLRVADTAHGCPVLIGQLNEELDPYGLTDAASMDVAYQMVQPKIAPLYVMIEALSRRWDATIRELGRGRDRLAERLRAGAAAAETAIEAEFHDLL